MLFISYGFGCSNVTAPESESALPHPPSVKGAGCSNVTAPDASPCDIVEASCPGQVVVPGFGCSNVTAPEATLVFGLSECVSNSLPYSNVSSGDLTAIFCSSLFLVCSS